MSEVTDNDALKRRILSLPKWAIGLLAESHEEIRRLERKVETLQGMVRCHEDGMGWSVVANPSDDDSGNPVRLFSLNEGGAILRVTLYAGDRLFVGRRR